MAGSQSDYLKAKVADYNLGLNTWTPPSSVFIALLTDTNTDAQRSAGTITEVTGGSYARVTVANNPTNWPNATGTTVKSKANGTAITFPTPTAGWGTVTAVAIWDAATAGNLLYVGPLAATLNVTTGLIVDFPIGTLVITLD